MSPLESLGITLMLAAAMLPLVVIFLFVYFAKRLEHKQIMAAIEKGTPLSELRPLKARYSLRPWIRYVSLGIGALVVAFGFMLSHREGTMAAFVVLGLGTCWLIRGILQRKFPPQDQNGTNNGVSKGTNLAGTCSPQAPLPANQ